MSILFFKQQALQCPVYTKYVGGKKKAGLQVWAVWLENISSGRLILVTFWFHLTGKEDAEMLVGERLDMQRG